MLLFLFISCEQEEIIDIDDQTSVEQLKTSKTKNASKLTDDEFELRVYGRDMTPSSAEWLILLNWRINTEVLSRCIFY